MAVKPFLGQVVASTPVQFRVATQKNVPPEESLGVAHVWGVRNQYITDRVRNQVRYSSTYDSCLFITAALGVEMDLASKKQDFYKGQS